MNDVKQAEVAFLQCWNDFKKDGSVKHAISFLNALDRYDALINEIEIEEREF